MEEQLPQTVTFITAFIAGLISFLSPCVLPLIPGYISFISGASLKQLSDSTELKKVRGRVMAGSLFFVLGFSAVFILLGASATSIGSLLSAYMRPLSTAAGIVIIILGIHMTGVLKLTPLYREKKIHLHKKPVTIFGAFIIGMAFAFGWTPCIGPILAGILIIAGGQDTVWHGILLLAVYSLGLGIPFLLTAWSITLFFRFFDKFKKHFTLIEWIAGLMLITIGILILTGGMMRIAALFSSFGGFAE
ncbi:MAG TPA: cytochrome c biogenesis protein CcdA [bacterium]|nr:cytochrome c biogenesis protein CcdA [bacterium]